MTLDGKGALIDFETPRIMGILNMTPDSFYDGGRYKDDRSALLQVEHMLAQGADFIDIGGQSTRPSAALLSAEQELKRVIPVLESIVKEFPDAFISVDTFYSEVARKAVERGAAMINDIAAGSLDENMFATIAALQVPYIIMHMRGTPQTMQTLTRYDDLIGDVLYYFSEKMDRLRALGVNDIVIDPGFGFSKTIPQNFELLKKLPLFKIFESPVLIGVSRKSSIYKTLKINPEEALNGTTALNTIALLNGADILRVHDVREARECLDLISLYKQV